MEKKKIEVVKDIHAENNRIAAEINREMSGESVLVVNVMGSPGAGKTSAIKQLAQRLPQGKVYVVEGDIESDIDTQTMLGLGIETVQINTHGACHLDAPMVRKALQNFKPKGPGFLFVENIGNLVCPVQFEIGEHLKMIVCSVPEGSDKPYKYPAAFEKASVIFLNKCDLKPYIDFDEDFFYRGIKSLNPDVPVFEVNSKTGEGYAAAARWFEAQQK